MPQVILHDFTMKPADPTELHEVAAVIAAQQGHELGRWRETNAEDVEVAYCRHCWRAAVVDVLRDPHLAGPALSERCAPRRPDAFLSNQHEADLRGGR